MHESSYVKTRQQNGIAEKKNGHLLDQTRALLFQRKVPKYFWEEVVLTATYHIYQLPFRQSLGLSDPIGCYLFFLSSLIHYY